jgi:hypothetical protein
MTPPDPFSVTRDFISPLRFIIQISQRSLTHSLLCGAGLGNDLDKLKAGGLSDLIMYTTDIGVRIRASNIDTHVADLAIEACSVDVPFVIFAISTGSVANVDISGEDS